MIATEWIPNVLVLGPGGIKGFAELGALIFLESVNYIDSIDTIVGCSVGSVIGLLLIIGYSATEILSEVIQSSIFDEIGSISLKDIKEKNMITLN